MHSHRVMHSKDAWGLISAILKFLIILFLDLCFVSGVLTDNAAQYCGHVQLIPGLVFHYLSLTVGQIFSPLLPDPAQGPLPRGWRRLDAGAEQAVSATGSRESGKVCPWLRVSSRWSSAPSKGKWKKTRKVEKETLKGRKGKAFWTTGAQFYLHKTQGIT